ncbi:putative lipid II flippase FtsW [Pygmaiobacter massiliensis]|uniref:putative lipid II flippase FtsW n=1 Tax=Pygmaiobacter massiliensis TaxID=1917873 RepID=UPI002A837BF2|nr:putative lipid II flippase FtsW [Pygmaiobacter massiliensis]MDY4784291.1 putative lipid II flippase FtsW [Pygmaiobacter massiliensis]
MKKVKLVKPETSIGSIDLPFMVLVLTLVIFGLIMLFSASYATAYYRFNDSYKFIKQQAFFAVIGVIAMFVASRVDYHIFHKLALPLLALTMVLLVIVLFMPELNGAKRWIFIPGLGNFQPSEVAKFAVIVLFANIIAVNADRMKTFSYGVLPFGIVLGAVAVLMLLEPHLSGTILICSIGAVMMFIGGTSLKWFGIGGAIGAGGITAAVLAFPDLVPYAMTRIEMWQNPFMDIQGKGHQTVQSLYAIGSGGLFGLGLGNSRQKHMYVPEPQNDFIFSIICEELGFVGAMLVVLLFVALLIRGATIAIYAKDKFGAMLVVGITAQVTIQAMLNIAVVTNTIPNTGISLPFFSYGGTSLLMLLGEMGIVLSVSRQCRYPKE